MPSVSGQLGAVSFVVACSCNSPDDLASPVPGTRGCSKKQLENRRFGIRVHASSPNTLS